MKIAIWCIHGNLQLPTAWDQFGGFFTSGPADESGKATRLPIEAENLWTDNATGLWNWAGRFCDRVQKQCGNIPQFLMGYSQGGRLAFHAILQCPSMWRAAVVVGASPGLRDGDERRARLRQDRAWANRFLTEPWEGVLAAWDAQPVFCGLPCSLPRLESEFPREKIARLLDLYSLGRQDVLSERLAGLIRPPILFVSGERDARYCEIGRVLQKNASICRHVIVRNAGHRVPWENPVGFVREVQKFLDTNG